MKKLFLSLLLLLFVLDHSTSAQMHKLHQSFEHPAWDLLERSAYRDAIVMCDKLIAENETLELRKQWLEKYGNVRIEELVKIEKFWTIRAVCIAHFIKAESYRKLNDFNAAVKSHLIVYDYYPYIYYWDETSWFWKPAEGSHEKIIDIYLSHQHELTPENVAEILKRFQNDLLSHDQSKRS
jgi:hypothetical protein